MAEIFFKYGKGSGYKACRYPTSCKDRFGVCAYYTEKKCTSPLKQLSTNKALNQTEGLQDSPSAG